MTALASTATTQPVNPSALVSSEWLYQNLHRPDLVILDASFFLPRQQRDAEQEFTAQHIPGALRFDIDVIADQQSPLPHTIPSADQFSRQVGQLGIDNQTMVVIYDSNHFFASARVWWMFRSFGHANVKILDGGVKRWKQVNYPMSNEITKPIAKQFAALFQPVLFVDLTAIQIIQRQQSKQILDARSEDSYQGLRPALEPGLKSGHIPGSINIPYRHLFIEEDHTLLPTDHLIKVFLAFKVDLNQPMLTTCGSGVSAAVLMLTLYQLGITEVPMYDGSWAEWARQ